MRDKIIKMSVLLFLGFLLIMPMGVVFLISIVPRWHTAIPTSFGLDWWILLFSKAKYAKIIFNSIYITLLSTLITVFYAVIASYVFIYCEFRGKGILSLIMLCPSYVSGVVIGLGLLTMYPTIRNTGLILVLGHFMVIIPLVYRSILSSMLKVPSNLIEVSQSLGSTQFNTFRKVILPLISKGIMAGSIISVGMNMSELSVSFFLYGPNWTLIPVQIYLEWWKGSLGVAGALATILALIAIITTYGANYLGAKEKW